MIADSVVWLIVSAYLAGMFIAFELCAFDFVKPVGAMAWFSVLVFWPVWAIVFLVRLMLWTEKAIHQMFKKQEDK